jgi:hypothetical protein
MSLEATRFRHGGHHHVSFCCACDVHVHLRAMRGGFARQHELMLLERRATLFGDEGAAACTTLSQCGFLWSRVSQV